MTMASFLSIDGAICRSAIPALFDAGPHDWVYDEARVLIGQTLKGTSEGGSSYADDQVNHITNEYAACGGHCQYSSHCRPLSAGNRAHHDDTEKRPLSGRELVRCRVGVSL